MQIKIILIQIALVFSLTHCASYDFSKRIIQQGNLLSAQRIDRLKVGMSKDEVAIIMGHSLLNPPFAENRWDYAFTWQKVNHPINVRHLVLYFKNDRLSRIERPS